MQDDITIRTATPADAPALLEIYAPYVINTTVTFEYTVPTLEDFTARVSGTLRSYPYLVAQRGDEILGYAYAGPFRSRAAYRWSAEASVYVRDGYHRLGIGRMLYLRLEEYLRRQNVTSVCACISHPNRASIKFHSSLDYERVARFNHVAWKHGSWIDVVYMQKLLSDSPSEPSEFIPFPEIV